MRIISASRMEATGRESGTMFVIMARNGVYSTVTSFVLPLMGFKELHSILKNGIMATVDHRWMIYTLNATVESPGGCDLMCSWLLSVQKLYLESVELMFGFLP